MAEIEGANHISILWFDDTVAETVAWLDGVFGIHRATPARIVDPRLGVALVYLVCLPAAFAGLGAVAGRLGPRAPQGPPPGLRTFALLGVALAAAAPITVLVEPAGFLASGYAEVVSYLAIGGAILCTALLYERRRTGGAGQAPARRGALARVTLALSRLHPARLAAVAAGCAGASLVLVSPLGAVFHRFAPTPQRALLAAAMAPLLGLFFVPLQATSRRGSLVRATTASVAGHFAVLLALAAGVVAGVLPGVVGLVLPLLAGVFALVEVFGFSAYAAGRAGILVGVVESTWVAGLAAVAMPLP